ncbi:MAG: ABC transporter permease [archaeon]|jgi:ABC-type nitrate/sulfonate/bicarbonate transport system permease component
MAQQQIKDLVLAAFPFIFLLLLWVVVVYFNWIPYWFLPSPLKVVMTFIELLNDGTILKIIIDTSINLIPPYLFAVVVSVVFGILIGSNATARKIFFPFISTLYPIPSLAWLPFIIIIFGFTIQSIWVLLFTSSFLKMIYNMISGVRNVNPIWILVAKNLGLNKWQIIYKVIIPGALPNILTGMRIGFGAIWRSVIGAEMLVTGAGGLGKFIWTAQWTYSFDKVLVGILLIAIIGLTIEFIVFKKLEYITLEKWGVVNSET